ncbi:MAG: hypothetical protein P1P89_12110 [Desulfobacterales bacterium]|nr:hypothetical protein [Desulfobacterales bacterium]
MILTITIDVPLPTATISASPDTIAAGGSAILTWSSTLADSCVITPDIGTVEPGGSLMVSPAETTTYVITAANLGGSATASVTVTVLYPPTVEMTATPDTIISGQTTTLFWTSTHADTALIELGVGSVPASGSVTVSPTETVSYTITVTGPGGIATAQAVVTVEAAIEPQPEGSFGAQYEDLIPSDATVESYDPKRFSLITGLVQAQNGTPIPDVSVTIHSHTAYGTALTDADGRFSIPVEGGSTITVVYQKEGLIDNHRKVYVPWNDIAIAETIQMISADPISTTVTFNGNPGTVITHKSSEVNDEFGNRSATLVFSGDNRAYSVDENGNVIQELTTIKTRATEFTTPESMPAILPPNSAYTYCVELGVDGVQRVRFEKPVITWIDNFLGFAVGEIVPVGYYDRDKGVWVPSDNGVVVKLLDTDNNGIVDALDANGDNQPDDLNNSGSFTDEVTGLNNPTRYMPGSTFWRVAVTHFTPWDANWPYGPPLDAISPNPPAVPIVDQQKTEPKDCQSHTSSFVEERSRIFHEDIPIPGTDITLHYAGNRVKGYIPVISVPASGDSVPGSLNGIIVRIEIAGRTLLQVLAPLPNQSANFIWDGLDCLGRKVFGQIDARVSIGFRYNLVYYSARGDWEKAFGQVGGGATWITGRQEIIAWKYNNIIVPSPNINGKEIIAEGWTISTHHSFNHIDPSTLHKGDGSISKNNAYIIDTVAGTGVVGGSGDGGLATQARLNAPRGVAVDAAGNLYIADTKNHRIRKVDTNGIIATIAGRSCGYYGGYSGDGGPATQACLNNPSRVVADASGNLYIADTYNHCIRKVDTSGIITTVAGNGNYGFNGDGGPATQAQLYYPSGVAVDVAGNLFIADLRNYRIRKVDTNGIITTVAGTGIEGYSGDGGVATQAKLHYLSDVALDVSGNIYITTYKRIRKIDNTGIITTVAGNGNYGFNGDGIPATQAWLTYTGGIDIDTSGNLYFTDNSNHRIRKVDTSGTITTVAGNGKFSFSVLVGDGGPATQAEVRAPQDVAVDASGDFYLPELYLNRIRKVDIPIAFNVLMTAGEIAFVEENDLMHIMLNAGRHLRTVDLDTGVTLYEFGYDQNNKLVSITNQFGEQITINRDANGIPYSITSPDGITTNLTVNADNHLTRITYPNGSYYNFEYTPAGLLTAKVEPEGNRFEHVFDSTGRLTDATDEEGGQWHYSRSSLETAKTLNEVSSAEGNLSSYLDHTYSTGKYTSTITDPTGAQTLFSQSADGLTANKSLPAV